MKTRGLFVVVVTALATLTKVLAGTNSFEPVADARVINLQGDQTVNFGADILSVYVASGNTQQTFIQFDLSSISNEQIQSATLTLTVSTAYGGNTTHQRMEIYRVLSPWIESGVTWSNRDVTHPWVTPGGDFVGTNGQPYSASTASPSDGQTVTWDVSALVQEWVTHVSANYGLLLKSYNGNSLTFRQREVATPAMRPNLTVVTDELPPFHAYSSAGQIVLWWTSTNAVLQERTNLGSTTAWADSGRTVIQSNGTNSVTISAPKGADFFRLRSGP